MERRSDEKHCSEKRDKASQNISYIGWQCFLDKLRIWKDGYPSLTCFRGVSSVPKAIISFYCKLVACTVNNIKSYSVWEITPQTSSCFPQHKLSIVSWLQPWLSCSRGICGFVHAVESGASQLLWTHNIHSYSCCRPMEGIPELLQMGTFQPTIPPLTPARVYFHFFGYITQPSLELQ